MPRAGLTRERVTDAAAQLIDGEGLRALTLARLASDLGVKTPSLYAHVSSLDDLHQELKLRGLLEGTERMRAATVGLAGRAALFALADAQRAYALERPGLYGFTARVFEGDPPPVHAAARAMLDVVLAALRGYGLEGDDALHATRCFRAATRGFLDLEITGGFGLPLEVDESYRRLIEMIDRGLRAEAAVPAPPAG